MSMAEWGNILKIMITNSVGERILLSQVSNCSIEVNVNKANDFNGLNSEGVKHSCMVLRVLAFL